MEIANEFEHVPVLFQETIEALCIAKNKGNILVDGTLWLGGHASEIIRQLHSGDRFIGFDRDRENLEVAARKVQSHAPVWVEFVPVHADFALLRETLLAQGIDSITGICYDLWVSSAHYDDGERGFSFRFDGPLDMRFDRDDYSIKTAADLVNTLGERELMHLFSQYWEEPKAIFIARAIVAERIKKPITTTAELSEIIGASSFDPKSKLRVFQALRIAVNKEFESIESSIRQAIEVLSPGGRIAVITFHSLEDRLVKTILKSYERDIPDPVTGRAMVKAVLKKIHKKPIEPSPEEIARNPRARSAKLRVAEKL